ncbi:hypothetical protein [Enterovibrio norvegicus]|uniref:hypothetical protein n=1 Tax=Enterovibrio norvegicus TaxID=188144 RepID=UPI000C82AE57|nr:hypothetical protein [Enterovibrio norvegicus]PMH64461.1 hypothetical protein BCU62_15515 [Enterovibrio norvegicus]
MKHMYLFLGFTASVFATSLSAQTIPQNDKTNMKLFFSAATPKEEIVYVPPLPELTLLSGRVTAPTSCKGNVGLSISNAFTDGTLKKIYDNFSAIVDQLASKEGMIFLSSLYVSKSNPNLYQLITEGINLGISDYLSAMGSCEAMAESLVDVAAGPVIEMQQQTQLNDLVEKNAGRALEEDWNNIRVEDIVRGGMDKLAENGVDIFGEKKAGKNQPALDLVKDTFKYGWCIYRGMSKSDCQKYYKAGNKDLPRTSESQQLIIKNIEDLDRAGFIILGNKYLSICQGCETIEVKGTGVTSWIELAQKDIFQLVNTLSQKKIQELEDTDFMKVGFQPSITVDANYFRNLAVLEKDLEVRNMYANGWAYDVAYQRAIAMMDALENTLNALETSDDVGDAGLTNEIIRLQKQLLSERSRLERTAKRNNYQPKMYIRALLGASERLSAGKSPTGRIGDSL